MAAKLSSEARMTIQELARRGWTRSKIGRTLGVTEGAVRYHLRRQAEGAVDGRSWQVPRAAAVHDVIAEWVGGLGEDEGVNLAELHDFLVEEHRYEGSLRSVQRYVSRQFPKPKLRARRRVETPPGAQAQVDWGHFPRILVGGKQQDLFAFHLQLSHSRKGAVIWSRRKHQLAWLTCHNESFRRIAGVPATVRVDNEKTAISSGAGAWGEVNTTYRRYAQAVRFHVDACQPRSPEAKGKVERRIRDHRLGSDPGRRHWESLEELQAWTDGRVERSEHRRICPPTGTSVWEAWQRELPSLGPVPILPEPFDLVAMRTVAHDCTVAFEGRRYSVPFPLLGQRVEVRGCADQVQVLAGAEIVASHPRHTESRLLLDSEHFEGEATDRVVPPPPLGKMGGRIAEIASMPPEQRPVDLYAALAEVAR